VLGRGGYSKSYSPSFNFFKKSGYRMTDNDENLIAYCGLYCKDCHGNIGKIPDLARDLRKELRKNNYDKFAAFISTYSFGKELKDYKKCYTVLGAMVKFRCKKGCKNGGGSPLCKIRNVQRKKIVMDAGNAKNLKHVKN